MGPKERRRGRWRRDGWDRVDSSGGLAVDANASEFSKYIISPKRLLKVSRSTEIFLIQILNGMSHKWEENRNKLMNSPWIARKIHNKCILANSSSAT